MDHKDEGLPSTALREIAVLKELDDHNGIVKLLDVFHGDNGNNLYLVFEYFNIDLKEFMDQHKLTSRDPFISLSLVKDVIYQCL